jgi:type IV pilus assembly protein PilW
MSLKQKYSSGFSLVELLVAVVIGLLGTLIIFQVFAVSESQKRTTASGGDAQQNGATALYTMERELRNAGYGYASLIQLGRPVYGFDVPNDQARPTQIFRPVLITPGVSSDTIDLSYSNFEGITHAVTLGADWNPNSTTMSVSNGSGMKAGDVLVVCDPNVPENTAPCIQVQITNKTSVDDLVLSPAPTAFVRGTATMTTEFNKAGGVASSLSTKLSADSKSAPAAYLAGKTTDPHTEVYNIGFIIDTARRYNVQNGRLMITGDDGIPQEYADGIVSVRAQYGMDTDANGSVDRWVNPRGNTGLTYSSYTPSSGFDITDENTTAASWSRVRAIRIAIVTRSNNIEKTAVENRNSIPLWINPSVGGSDSAPSFNLTTTDDHRYRYTVFDSVIPFRNMIWNPHRL